MSAPDLSGLSVLLTGAAGGFGRVITDGLLAAGASVMATDVADTVMSMEGPAGRLVTRVLDISDAAACAEAVAEIEDRFGKLDVLINNGAMGMPLIRRDAMANLVAIEEVSPAVWDKFIGVNLSGAWYLTHAAIPGMKAQGAGRIISVTTSFFTMMRARFHPYGPAKAALEAMSAGHAVEFAPFGIAVNIVVPGGAANTPMVPEGSGFDPATLVQPEEMVPPILWLCSQGAEVTGTRYVAGRWKPDATIDQNRDMTEAPIGWPDLAADPVWPGGKPDE